MTTNRLSLRNNATSSRSGSTGSAASGSERCEECGATGTPLVTERRPRSQSPQKTSVGARRRAYSMSRKSKTTVKGWLKKIEKAMKHSSDSKERNVPTLSFMTLLWPILPTPSPESVSGSPMRDSETETCDVCGSPDIGLPFQERDDRPKSAQERTRAGDAGRAPDSQVLKKITDTGKQIDATISSIEESANKAVNLNKMKKGDTSSARGSTTDAELLGTLDSLVKTKSHHEEKVKQLEEREDKLKGDLMAAIQNSKSVEVAGIDKKDIEETNDNGITGGADDEDNGNIEETKQQDGENNDGDGEKETGGDNNEEDNGNNVETKQQDGENNSGGEEKETGGDNEE